MIMDAQLLFDGSMSANGVLSGSSCSAWAAGSHDSANVIDVSQIAGSKDGQGRDIGIGGDPSLQLFVETSSDFAGGAGATLQVEILTAPDDGSGAPGSWTVLEETPALTVADIAGQEIFRVPVPVGIEKFIKLTYVVGTAALTAGSIIAGIVVDRQALGPNLGYPNGYSNQYI